MRQVDLVPASPQVELERLEDAEVVVHDEHSAHGFTTRKMIVVEDETGSLVLAFLGRRRVGGIEVGRSLVAAGTVLARHGRLLVLNPYVWLRG